MRELDADPDVDVIVLARGGGSVEDLLPFSDETLCREIAKCTTPVVSAIGHEPDNPLCDLVADVRAATPTDAAKRIVPDAAAEQALVADLRRRSARALRNWVHREQQHADPAAQPAGAGAAAAGARRPAPRRSTGPGPTARRDITRLLDAESEQRRAPVGAARHTGTGGHPGPRLRGGADVVGLDGGTAVDGGRAGGHPAAGPRRRRRDHDGQRGVR